MAAKDFHDICLFGFFEKVSNLVTPLIITTKKFCLMKIQEVKVGVRNFFDICLWWKNILPKW